MAKPKIATSDKDYLHQQHDQVSLHQRVHNYLSWDSPKIDSAPFSMEELETAIKKLPCRKACGGDGIYNEFFIFSSNKTKQVILQVCNLIWSTHFTHTLNRLPHSFLNSIICPVLKPGKIILRLMAIDLWCSQVASVSYLSG